MKYAEKTFLLKILKDKPKVIYKTNLVLKNIL
jgi:hypothetical protein